VTPPPLPGEEPLTSARFTLSADGQPIAGVVRVSALELSGGGIGVTVAPLTITRLVGADGMFHTWSHDVLGRGGDRTPRNLVLTVHDAAGEPAAAWELRGVMPVTYSPACQLDALTPHVVTETLTVSVTEIRPVQHT
jgi:T4-like virus tail tube protein gp19